MSDPHAGLDASAWVVRHAACVPCGGAVLDVACGPGRHSRLFLALGHPVCAVDRDSAAVAAIDSTMLEVVTADLESAPWPLGERTFAAVVVTNYLWRPLLPRLVAAVAPGGVLLYETFAEGHERLGRPRNPDFLLRAGELLEVVGGSFDVHTYEHGPEGDPPVAIRQRLCARRR